MRRDYDSCKQIKKKGDKTTRKKWITKAIIFSCKKKELLYNLWQKNIESENLKRNIWITLRYSIE